MTVDHVVIAWRPVRVVVPAATFGVTYGGVVLVNPTFASKLGVTKMLRLIRRELKIARDLRDGVKFME